jgi:hypothetical protein
MAAYALLFCDWLFLQPLLPVVGFARGGRACIIIITTSNQQTKIVMKYRVYNP